MTEIWLYKKTVAKHQYCWATLLKLFILFGYIISELEMLLSSHLSSGSVCHKPLIKTGWMGVWAQIHIFWIHHYMEKKVSVLGHFRFRTTFLNKYSSRRETPPQHSSNKWTHSPVYHRKTKSWLAPARYPLHKSLLLLLSLGDCPEKERMLI